MRFVYDAQGRIVSVVESDFRYLDDGTSKPDRISTVEYDGQSMTIADPHSKYSCELADGRAVSMTGAWAETMEFSGECAETYSYDAAGYLFRRTYRDITPSNMKIRSPLQTTFLRDGTDLSRAKNSS